MEEQSALRKKFLAGNQRTVRKGRLSGDPKKSGRFLSIVLIVAIGAAFFAGIRATEPDMRYTGDAYSDKFQSDGSPGGEYTGSDRRGSWKRCRTGERGCKR